MHATRANMYLLSGASEPDLPTLLFMASGCGHVDAVPFGPFSRASSAASGSSSFSEPSVWVLACPLTDIISPGTAAFIFEEVGEGAPATATSCCFCNAACKSRKSEESLTRKANKGDTCSRMHSDAYFSTTKHSAPRSY